MRAFVTTFAVLFACLAAPARAQDSAEILVEIGACITPLLTPGYDLVTCIQQFTVLNEPKTPLNVACTDPMKSCIDGIVDLFGKAAEAPCVDSLLQKYVNQTIPQSIKDVVPFVKTALDDLRKSFLCVEVDGQMCGGALTPSFWEPENKTDPATMHFCEFVQDRPCCFPQLRSAGSTLYTKYKEVIVKTVEGINELIGGNLIPTIVLPDAYPFDNYTANSVCGTPNRTYAADPAPCVEVDKVISTTPVSGGSSSGSIARVFTAIIGLPLALALLA